MSVITSVVRRACVSLSAPLCTADSSDGTTAEQSRGGGKVVVFPQTCLVSDKTLASWQRPNVEGSTVSEVSLTPH